MGVGGVDARPVTIREVDGHLVVLQGSLDRQVVGEKQLYDVGCGSPTIVMELPDWTSISECMVLSLR